jgi:GAF domain-containing protein
VNEDRFRAAVAAGVLAGEAEHRALLRSIVEVARSMFSAAASSIVLLDEETDELVFEAVAGAGEDTLVGQRYPSSKGVSGWVINTRQPLVIDDVSKDPRHARDVAERTGYVPQGLMAVPLLHEERSLGVLSVLDRQTAFSLAEMDLLGMFANQAAIALELLQRARRARAALDGAGADVRAVAGVAAALDALEGEQREAGARLLAALEEVLRK